MKKTDEDNENKKIDIKAYRSKKEEFEKYAYVDQKDKEMKLGAIKYLSQGRLLATQSVFPFEFSPTKIAIDRIKVDIVSGSFLGSKKEFTIPILQIENVVLLKGVLFATLHIEVRGIKEQPPYVHYLRKSEATKIKDLIQALKLCYDFEADIGGLGTKEIIQLSRQVAHKKV